MKHKTPLRRCVVTRDQFPKRELIRVVRTKEGVVSVDLTGRANGRGAYLQKNSEII
ncbi:MAG: YlxR family protein, partial [Culicoidibacterales bacterium]